MDAAETWNFYICHATPDLAIAQRFHRELARSARAYLGHDNLPPGARFDLALPEAQERSRFTIVLVSHHQRAAHFASSEIQRGIQLERDWTDSRSSRPHEVVPVWLEGRPKPTGAPQGLEMKRGLDAVALGFDETVRQILMLINGAATSPPPSREDDLARYSRTRVEKIASVLIDKLVQELAAITHRDLYDKAAAIISAAAEMRRQADPLDKRVTVLTPTEAYMHNATANQYWANALRLAGLHGGRMFAAVLLVVPDDSFSREGLAVKRQVLASLRESNSMS